MCDSLDRQGLLCCKTDVSVKWCLIIPQPINSRLSDTVARWDTAILSPKRLKLKWDWAAEIKTLNLICVCKIVNLSLFQGEVKCLRDRSCYAWSDLTGCGHLRLWFGPSLQLDLTCSDYSDRHHCKFILQINKKKKKERKCQLTVLNCLNP